MTVDYSGLLGQVRDLQGELAAIRKSVQLLRQVSQSSDTAKDSKGETPKAKRRGRPPKAAKPAADTDAKPKRRGRPPKAAKPAADTDAKPKRRGRPPKAAKPAGMPSKPQGRGRLRKNLPKKPTRHRGRPRQSKL